MTLVFFEGDILVDMELKLRYLQYHVQIYTNKRRPPFFSAVFDTQFCVSDVGILADYWDYYTSTET
jgi:hypothetical protein